MCCVGSCRQSDSGDVAHDGNVEANEEQFERREDQASRIQPSDALGIREDPAAITGAGK